METNINSTSTIDDKVSSKVSPFLNDTNPKTDDTNEGPGTTVVTARTATTHHGKGRVTTAGDSISVAATLSQHPSNQGPDKTSMIMNDRSSNNNETAMVDDVSSSKTTIPPSTIIPKPKGLRNNKRATQPGAVGVHGCAATTAAADQGLTQATNDPILYVGKIDKSTPHSCANDDTRTSRSLTTTKPGLRKVPPPPPHHKIDTRAPDIIMVNDSSNTVGGEQQKNTLVKKDPRNYNTARATLLPGALAGTGISGAADNTSIAAVRSIPTSAVNPKGLSKNSPKTQKANQPGAVALSPASGATTTTTTTTTTTAHCLSKANPQGLASRDTTPTQEMKKGLRGNAHEYREQRLLHEQNNDSEKSIHVLGSSNTHELAVARPVRDVSIPVLLDVQEVDPEELEKHQTEEKKRKECRMVGYAIAAVSIIISVTAIVLGVYLLGKTDETILSFVPSYAPSMPPTDSPSFSPSGVLDMIRGDLPEHTLASLDTYGTPQWKAWDWLLRHQNISNLEEWRKKQLFALVTFYYALEGETWYEPLRERWLDDTKDECFWFSTGYGWFDDGEYKEWPRNQIPSCNDDGEFVSLLLRDLQLSGTPTMPPEIALLTSLSTIELNANGINATLSAMLPSELGQLTRLRKIDLSKNELNGTLPTHLGLMTSLTTAFLSRNKLIGPIPSELGLMSNMVALSLRTNELSNSIPTELALCTNLQILRLENNTVTGTLPSAYSLPADNSLTSSTGALPDGLCSLGAYASNIDMGLSFDCSDQLCGCCWCPCPGGNYSNDCDAHPFNPSLDDREWPGSFPSPINRSNVITINIRTDGYPGETYFYWSLQKASGQWELKDAGSPADKRSISSYTIDVASDSIYRIQIFDSEGDGICCRYGLGWFTITNSTPSESQVRGTVMWEAPGYDLSDQLELFLSVDENGNAQLVDHVFAEESLLEDHNVPVELEANSSNSSLSTNNILGSHLNN